ncbi:alanine racemase [Micromonospora sp. NBC_01699]|uniref:alanine racemase n=1 Tax=Micromonospora sp. NBC_01699 TaxID=2975984 RepID=UPI002E37B0E8|nr:alanine racemase [Micromonospora sp. NBC_01699]
MDLPPSAAGRPALTAADLPPAVRDHLLSGTHTADPVSGYLYDPAVAVRRATELRTALPEWARVCYAVKANSYPPLVHALAPYVDGFEVASAEEATLARQVRPDAGNGGRLMVAAGPAKTERLLHRLIDLDVDVVNVESPLELHRLQAVADRLDRRVDVALRVNPATVAVTGALTMGGAATQFGIPEAEVPDVLRLAASLPRLRVVGFHVHVVGNNLDPVAHAAYVAWCLDWSRRTAAAHGLDLRIVDVGGGLGVPFGGEEPFDVKEFGSRVADLTPPPDCRVLLEPGRYLVTDAGWYAAEVVDVKHAYGTWFVVLRGGINHFQLPTSWDIPHRFAILPVEHWPHPYPRPEVRDHPVTVVGELCTTEDTLARDVTVTSVRPGDLVVFPMAGSYGWEFAMPTFLSHPPATRTHLHP